MCVQCNTLHNSILFEKYIYHIVLMIFKDTNVALRLIRHINVLQQCFVICYDVIHTSRLSLIKHFMRLPALFYMSSFMIFSQVMWHPETYFKIERIVDAFESKVFVKQFFHHTNNVTFRNTFVDFQSFQST